MAFGGDDFHKNFQFFFLILVLFYYIFFMLLLLHRPKKTVGTIQNFAAVLSLFAFNSGFSGCYAKF